MTRLLGLVGGSLLLLLGDNGAGAKQSSAEPDIAATEPQCAYPDLTQLSFCPKFVGRGGGYSTRCGGARLTGIADRAAERVFERLAAGLATREGDGDSHRIKRVDDPNCRDALIAASCASVFPKCSASAKAADLAGVDDTRRLCQGPSEASIRDAFNDPQTMPGGENENGNESGRESSGKGGDDRMASNQPVIGAGGSGEQRRRRSTRQPEQQQPGKHRQQQPDAEPEDLLVDDGTTRGGGGIALRGEPYTHDSLLRGLLGGVCKSMCYELAVKCGLSPYRCRLATSMPEAQPCTEFALDPQVGCREPFARSLRFCSGVRFPVLAAPFGTGDTWAEVDADAEAAYSALARPGDTDQCHVALKNYACSLELPRCHEQSNAAVPMCRSACTGVKRHCGREAPMDCSDDRVFADESSCSMYIKEPGADRAAVAGLVAVLILAVGAVTVLFVRQFTGQHKRSGYSRVPREEGGYEMGTSDGL